MMTYTYTYDDTHTHKIILKPIYINRTAHIYNLKSIINILFYYFKGVPRYDFFFKFVSMLLQVYNLTFIL